MEKQHRQALVGDSGGKLYSWQQTNNTCRVIRWLCYPACMWELMMETICVALPLMKQISREWWFIVPILSNAQIDMHCRIEPIFFFSTWYLLVVNSSIILNPYFNHIHTRFVQFIRPISLFTAGQERIIMKAMNSDWLQKQQELTREKDLSIVCCWAVWDSYNVHFAGMEQRQCNY